MDQDKRSVVFSTPVNDERVEYLTRRLAEAEAMIQALVAGQVDAAVDPEHSSPILLRHTQQALLESESRYRRLVNRMSALVFELEPDGSLHFVNDAITYITGYTPEELHGKDWVDLFFPEDLRQRLEDLYEYLLSGDVTNYEVDLMAKGGVPVTLQLNTANVYHPDGSLSRIVGFGIDISERKQIEGELYYNLDELRRKEEELRLQNKKLSRAQKKAAEQQQRYQQLFEFAPDGYLVTDKGGTIQEANRAAASLLGISQEQLAGKSIRNFIASDEQDAFQRKLQQLDHRTAIRGWETFIQPRNGAAVPTALIVTAEWNGHVGSPMLLWLFYDITERKRADQILRDQKNILQSILSSMGEAVVVVDETGRILLFNPAAEALHGSGPIPGTLEEFSHSYTFYLPDAVTPYPENMLPLKRALNGEEVDLVNVFVRSQARPDGIWLDGTARPLRSETGGLRGGVLVFYDVTDRKQTEFALQISEANYRAIVEDQTELICRWLPEGPLTFVNTAYRRYLGSETQELIGQNFLDLVYPEDQDFVKERIGTLSPTNPVLVFEHRLALPSGRVRWQQWSDRGIFNDQGELVMIQSVGRDITERKLAEEALRSSQRMFERLFESNPDATILSDREGRILRMNRQTTVKFGYTQEEMLGKPVDTLLPERLRQQNTILLPAYFKDPASRPTVQELDVYGKRKDGTEFPLHITLSPLQVDEDMQVICVLHDLTLRKQAELELREKDRLIQTAVTGLPIVLFVIDKEGSIRLSMGRSVVAPGYESNVAGRSIFEVYQDAPEMIENYRRALQGQSFNTFVNMFDKVFDARYAPLLDDQGKILGVMGVAVDITDRREAQEALRQSEERFHTIFEASGIGINLVDLDGRILESNPALQEMLGYSAEELGSMTFTDFTLPEDRLQNQLDFQELARGEVDEYSIEKQFTRKDGTPLWAHMTVTLFRGNDGSPRFAISMVENITERKQMEFELAEVQRRLMDSTEAERLRLAQELHDGPVQDLYGITYQIENLRDDLPTEESQRQLTLVQSALQQVVTMLRATCGELRPPTLAPFGLEKAIRAHADRFQQTYPDLQLNLELMSDGQLLPERVRLALYRIYQQILTNVVRHAKASQVVVRFTVDVEQIILEIEDNGRGFVLPKRWVTLAREGHMGLVGATERAEAIGGTLDINSRPGEGTVVKVIVPRPLE